jgi:protein-tyrosine phosphatase
MASALLRIKITDRLDAASWRIDSAGVWTNGGYPVSENAQIVLKEHWGLDLSAYRSKCVSGELLGQFDLILVMEYGHKEALQVEFPEFANRIYLLYEMVGLNEEIRDPYGGTMADYQDTARELDQILTKGIERIIRLSDTP